MDKCEFCGNVIKGEGHSGEACGHIVCPTCTARVRIYGKNGLSEGIAAAMHERGSLIRLMVLSFCMLFPILNVLAIGNMVEFSRTCFIGKHRDWSSIRGMVTIKAFLSGLRFVATTGIWLVGLACICDLITLPIAAFGYALSAKAIGYIAFAAMLLTKGPGIAVLGLKAAYFESVLRGFKADDVFERTYATKESLYALCWVPTAATLFACLAVTLLSLAMGIEAALGATGLDLFELTWAMIDVDYLYDLVASSSATLGALTPQVSISAILLLCLLVFATFNLLAMMGGLGRYAMAVFPKWSRVLYPDDDGVMHQEAR